MVQSQNKNQIKLVATVEDALTGGGEKTSRKLPDDGFKDPTQTENGDSAIPSSQGREEGRGRAQSTVKQQQGASHGQ